MKRKKMNIRELAYAELQEIPEESLIEIIDFIQFNKMKTVQEKYNTVLLCESSLKKDWLSPEETLAWQNL